MQATALRSVPQPSVLVLASDARGGDICDTLEDVGWRVRCPETAAEAISVLAAGWPCDAVVAEIGNEVGIGGLEVGRLARKLLGHLPVIYLSTGLAVAKLKASAVEEAIFLSGSAGPGDVAARLLEALTRV